jgi:hypothetical protein
MSNLTDFRIRVQDKVQPQQQNAIGDGVRTVYFLESVPVIAGSETVAVGGTSYAQDSTPETNQLY